MLIVPKFFLIFSLVCGFASNVKQMLAFRFLAGLGACAPQTVGSGVLSDLWTPEQRGMALAIYTMSPIAGPALGPLIGAWITERTTWRWSFWAITIFGVTVQILVYFTLHETYAPRILHWRARKLRKETGNDNFQTVYERADKGNIKIVLRRALTRVFIFLATQPIAQFLALYIALIYGIVFLLLYSFPMVWSRIYHMSTGIGGLNYISLLIGFTVGGQSSGRLLDLLYRRFKRLKRFSPDGQGRPEFRVPILWMSTFLVSGGLFMFGWSAQAHTHWIVPNIGALIFGIGAIMTFTALQAYTIDCYQLYAASAVGVTAMSRSAAGFGFPLFADSMFAALGQGWGNSVLAFAAIGIGYSGSTVLWFWGPKLRAASNYAAA